MPKKHNYAAMFTLRKDGRYQATYTDKAGKRKFLYDKDPEKLYYKLQKATKEDEEKIITFREVAESWENAHREEIENRTWKNYKPHYEEILELHGNKPLEEVSPLDVINHLTRAKKQGYSATVVVTIKSIYRMIFDHAIAFFGATYNPAASARLPKGLKRGKRSAPSDEIIKIILQNTDKHFGYFPFFLLCTGLRKSEALSLTWADVDFCAREIKVVKSLDYDIGAKPKPKDPKTDAGYRTVPIVDMLYDKLLEMKERSDSPYLFPAYPSNRGGKGGGIMTLRGYEGAWMKYCTEVGLTYWDDEDQKYKPLITAHNLRHGTVTIMFEAGTDELTAQKVLGHANITTTRAIYTDLRNAQKAKSVKKFNKEMMKYTK